MSGADTEQFNTLERAVSGDFNDLQSISARFLSELLKYGTARRDLTGTDLPTSWVLGGLEATPTAGNITISPGAMMQLSDTLAPLPGPLDSNYRLSRLETPTVVALPAPGVTTVYLVEAQMVEVVTDTQSRDIYNPGTQTFTPTLVTKVTERRIVFQVVAGNSSAPAPTGGDWVPIVVVRRPPGGPAVTTADIWDVRPVCEFGTQRPNSPIKRSRKIQTSNAVANTVSISAVIDGQRGTMTVETITPVDVTSAPFLSPGTVLAGSTKFYLYLAPYFLTNAPKQVGAALLSKGVLVLSSVAPTHEGFNSGLVPLPAPWAVADANAFTAYYVGTLVRNSTNTGWVRMVADDAKVTLWEGDVGAMALSLAPIPATSAVLLSLVPVTARQVSVSCQMTGAGGSGAPNAIGLSLRPTGAAVFFQSTWVNTDDVDYRVLNCAYDGSGAIQFDCAGVPGGVASLNLLQVGWLE